MDNATNGEHGALSVYYIGKYGTPHPRPGKIYEKVLK
jgi:hypothetical protein